MQKTLAALTIVTVITAGLSAGPLAADTEFEDNIPIDLVRAFGHPWPVLPRHAGPCLSTTARGR